MQQLPLAVLLILACPAVASAQGACTGPITETRTIVESDVSTGNLNAPVGKRFIADLDRASAACSAGHSPEALRLLSAAKGRYGYR